MANVQSYASGREVVLWCAQCQKVVARLGGMHPVEYIYQISQEHECIDNGKD